MRAVPMSAEEAKATLLSQREMMLKSLEALRHRLVGFDMAIAIVAEEIAASAGRNPEGEDREDGLRAEHEHAVPEGETPKDSPSSSGDA
jgi:hypothetical protein